MAIAGAITTIVGYAMTTRSKVRKDLEEMQDKLTASLNTKVERLETQVRELQEQNTALRKERDLYQRQLIHLMSILAKHGLVDTEEIKHILED